MKRTLLSILCAFALAGVAKADEAVAIFAGNSNYEGSVETKYQFTGEKSESIIGKSFDLTGVASFVMGKMTDDAKESYFDPTAAKPQLYWYKNNSMTITPAAGVTLTKIAFEGTNATYTQLFKCSAGNIEKDGKTTVVWTGSATKDLVFELENTASQVARIQWMIVEYTKGGSTAIAEVGIDAASGEVKYYNLQGVQVAEPVKGEVYVRCENGNATKVVM